MNVGKGVRFVVVTCAISSAQLLWAPSAQRLWAQPFAGQPQPVPGQDPQPGEPPEPPTVQATPAPQVPSAVRLGVPASQGLTGTITGRLVYGDTQQPARFAQVVLVPAQVVQADSQPGGGIRGFAGMGGNGRTDLDGNFTLTNVAAGDYYVAGQSAGYISETSMLQARAADGENAQALLTTLPVAHVTAGGTATVNVSLTRGGTLAGRIQWDDGSPATGVQVSAVLVTVGTSSTAAINQGGGQGGGRGGFGGGFAGGAGSGTLADDRGYFRISGLMPGTYYVRATLQAPISGGGTTGFLQRSQAMIFYAPSKVRRADAETVTLHEGEERGDIQLLVDLRSMHTLSGRVGATSGPEPESGSVRLVDATDSTLSRTGAIAPDGTFTLSYVPAGNYTLSISGASSNPSTSFGGRRGQQTSTGVTYQQYTGTLTVTDTDVSGISISLTPNSN